LRTTAALLALLLIAVAAYIAFLPKIEPILRSVLLAGKPGMAGTSPALPPKDRGSEAAAAQSSPEPPNIKTLLNEAETLAAQHRFEESRLFLQRILEISPAYEPALALLHQIEASAPGTSPGDPAKIDLRKELAGVSSLIVSGQLSSAKAALDRLQRSHPDAPGVLALRRQWESANYKAAAELKRREEAQKEEDRLRRVTDLYARGNYDEAGGELTLWTADDPSSAQAQRLKGQIEDVQRSLRAYDTALAEGRYQDAINALGRVQQLNASDPNLSGMREQLERRISSARAVLTVRRLGSRGTLLLDGKPAGSDGEIENESVPIGSHTLAVADQRSVQISRAVELREGQRIAYVYDLQKQLLRPMTEGDAELAARGKALEEVHRFAVEHTHGLFRGGCKGTLEISLFEVAYEPASGTHRFRIPFSRLKLNVSGKSLDLAYVSDGKAFQSFRVEDPQAAEKLKRLWDSLRALDQRVTDAGSAQVDGSSRDSPR
jgi:tetratricopeptide (TPR) repeat protein